MYTVFLREEVIDQLTLLSPEQVYWLIINNKGFGFFTKVLDPTCHYWDSLGFFTNPFNKPQYDLAKEGVEIYIWNSSYNLQPDEFKHLK